MKSLGFIVLWLVGSVVAVSVAFAGIAVVDDDLIDPPAAQVANLTSTNSVPPVGPAAPAGPTTGNNAVADEGTPAADRPTPTPTVETSTPSPTVPTTVPAIPPTSVPVSPAPVPPTPVSPTSAPPTSVSATSAPLTPVSPTPVPPTSVSATSAPLTPVSPTPVPPTPVPPTPIPPTPVPPTPIPPTPVPPTPTPILEPAAQILTFNLVGGTTAISFSSDSVEVLWASPNPGFDVEISPGSNEVRVEFESDNHKSRIEASWAGGPAHEIREDSDD